MQMLSLLAGTGLWLAGSGMEASEAWRAQANADAALLRSGGLTLSSENQTEYLERFLLDGTQRGKATAWIEQLGDLQYGMREKALAGLRKLGPGVIPSLQRVLGDSNLERHHRAEICLRFLEGQMDLALLEASARFLARHAESGRGEILWRLLESCPDPIVAEEIAGELLLLSEKDKGIRKQIGKGETASFPAQRALFFLGQMEQAKTKERRLFCWKQMGEAAPGWSLGQPEPPGDKGELAIGAGQRSRQALRHFLKGLRQGEVESSRRQCHLPFCLGGRLALRNANELDEFLTQTLDGLKGKNWTCHLLEVSHLKSYGPSEEEQALLKDIPVLEIRVVHVRAGLIGAGLEEGYFFVRLLPRAGLVGIGEKTR